MKIKRAFDHTLGLMVILVLVLSISVQTVGAQEGTEDPPPPTEGRQQMMVTVGDEPVLSTAPKAIFEGKPPSRQEPEPVDGHSAIEPVAGWSTIIYEGFEGTFPGDWVVLDSDGATNGEYYWGKDDYRPYSGTYSAWAARSGANGLDPQYNDYPLYTKSWMVYGPFDLSDAADADVQFEYWNISEQDYDYLFWGASINGSNFYGDGVWGDSLGWQYVDFDLTNVYTLGDLRGEPEVWFGFYFYSDELYNFDGPFLDEIYIEKLVSELPNLTPYTPSSWYGPIVPSGVTGTNSLGSLQEDATTYVDFAWMNASAVDILGEFDTCLHLDAVSQFCFTSTGLAAGSFVTYEDYALVVDTPGWHQLGISVDTLNEVGESVESDNIYYESFYWMSASGPDCDAILSSFDQTLGGLSVPSKDETSPSYMPPHPDLLERVQRGELTLPEFITNPDLAAAAGIDQPGKVQPVLSGTWRALAILVEFTDNQSAVGASYFDTLLFGSAAGTMDDYYDEVSYGALDIVTVNLPSSIGWCTMPSTYAYYVNNDNGFGAYPQNARKLAEDAVFMVDPVVDFTQYDNDSDGLVDTVFVIHAGPGAEFTGSLQDIWSHSWSTVNDPVVDGVMVNSYTTEPEYWNVAGDMTAGVYAHELGHVFGLPDLYDTDYSSEGVGQWSLMAGGSWNGPTGMGNSPAHLDAWSRAQLGWLSPTNVTTDTVGATIPEVENNAVAYRLWTLGAAGPEYFMVENRQLTGYDAYLPGAGLLITHIDETRGSNSLECANPSNWLCGTAHPIVAVEQADGLFQLEAGGPSNAGDPYPGTTTNRNFTAATLPNSSSYSGSAPTLVLVTNISDSGASMTADLAIGVPPGNKHPIADFNGDEITDLSVFKVEPWAGMWYIQGQAAHAYGNSASIPVPCDYDGNGTTDVAVYNAGTWYVKDLFVDNWGDASSIPVPGDYDGNGTCDLAVYKVEPWAGMWYIQGQAAHAYGNSASIPVPGYYDADADMDIAVYNDGTWYIKDQFVDNWGDASSIPVPGDYDGDGVHELAVYKVEPWAGMWYIQGLSAHAYGNSASIPVPGYYDADDDLDIAVYNAGTWYVKDLFVDNWGDAASFPLPAHDTNGDGDPYQ